MEAVRLNHHILSSSLCRLYTNPTFILAGEIPDTHQAVQDVTLPPLGIKPQSLGCSTHSLGNTVMELPELTQYNMT